MRLRKNVLRSIVEMNHHYGTVFFFIVLHVSTIPVRNFEVIQQSVSKGINLSDRFTTLRSQNQTTCFAFNTPEQLDTVLINQMASSVIPLCNALTACPFIHKLFTFAKLNNLILRGMCLCVSEHFIQIRPGFRAF